MWERFYHRALLNGLVILIIFVDGASGNFIILNSFLVFIQSLLIFSKFTQHDVHSSHSHDFCFKFLHHTSLFLSLFFFWSHARLKLLNNLIAFKITNSFSNWSIIRSIYFYTNTNHTVCYFL